MADAPWVPVRHQDWFTLVSTRVGGFAAPSGLAVRPPQPVGQAGRLTNVAVRAARRVPALAPSRSDRERDRATSSRRLALGRSRSCSPSARAHVLPDVRAAGRPGPAHRRHRARADDVARIRHSLGLDQPFLAQLGQYAGPAVQGDFGHSFSQNMDVLPLILQRFPATAQLAVAGLIIELVIGVPLGRLAATRRGSVFDRGLDGPRRSSSSRPRRSGSGSCCSIAVFQPHQARLDVSAGRRGYKAFDLRYLCCRR